MFDIEKYLDDITAECKAVFGERLIYIGLQGSYLRGEARENSDIDIMVVIDGFSVSDMDSYKAILKRIGYYEKSCGFICGKDELARWNPLEVCQLIHTTKDIYGSLKELLPESDRTDEINYTAVSLNNLYHEICHRYIHANREKNITKFPFTCKSLFYLIQNLHYLESGDFITTKKALKEAVSQSDREILSLGENTDEKTFDSEFNTLFEWCRGAFSRIDRLRK